MGIQGENNLNNFLRAGFLTKNNISFSAVSDRSNLRMSVSQSVPGRHSAQYKPQHRKFKFN